jgi:plasmid stability protein
MDAYPLRNIPDDLWHRVKVRAMTDHLSVREVILAGLRLYAAEGLDAFTDAGTTLDVQGTTGGKATTGAATRLAAAR